MTKSVGLSALIAAAFTLIAPLALAAQPQKGAVYFGGTGGEESAAIRFEVSANGSMLTKFSGPYAAACSNPAAANPNYQKQARISGGHFAVKEIVPAHSKNSVVISGRFGAHGSVKGKITIATQCLQPPNFNSGPVKHKTVSWSGTSEPHGAGSAYCLSVSRQLPGKGPFTFEAITEVATTCKVVDKAIDAGNFTTTTEPPDIFGQFTTAGWTCTRGTGNENESDRYSCTKAKASFSFSQGL
jgi:hypothetical protein